jgi:hypothetical protein
MFSYRVYCIHTGLTKKLNHCITFTVFIDKEVSTFQALRAVSVKPPGLLRLLAMFAYTANGPGAEQDTDNCIMNSFTICILHQISLELCKSTTTLEDHVACTGDMRNIHEILVGKPERNTPLRKPRCRWKDNIKLNLK